MKNTVKQSKPLINQYSYGNNKLIPIKQETNGNINKYHDETLNALETKENKYNKLNRNLSGIINEIYQFQLGFNKRLSKMKQILFYYLQHHIKK